MKPVVQVFGEEGYVSIHEFLDWLESVPDEKRDPHFRSIVNQIKWNSLSFDMIGAVESISSYDTLKKEVESRLVSEASGDLKNLFRNMNSTRSRRVIESYSDVMLRIYSMYKDDFEAFGYSKCFYDIDLPPLITKKR